MTLETCSSRGEGLISFIRRSGSRPIRSSWKITKRTVRMALMMALILDNQKFYETIRSKRTDGVITKIVVFE